MRVPIDQIQPWRCAHPQAARDYAKQLRAGAMLAPIHVIRQRGPYRYRIFDGMHRARGSKLAGRCTVAAVIIAVE
jgi:hypothetical protein